MYCFFYRKLHFWHNVACTLQIFTFLLKQLRNLCDNTTSHPNCNEDVSFCCSNRNTCPSHALPLVFFV